MHQSLRLPPHRVSATMSKLEKIKANLKLAESKKEALQQAFETLKSNASSVASFTLQWSDLDSHFSSLRSSIQIRLEELQSQLHQIESNAAILVNLFTHKQPNSICSQVSGVLRSSPSPVTLVLDTIPLLLKNDKGDFEESSVRDCVLLLEQLVQLVSIPSKIDDETREKARPLAVEWKEKMRVESVGEVMGFFDILGIYGLVGEFDRGDLLELIEVVAVQDRAPELCRVLELEEKMPEFIQKLILKGKQIQAIKFIYEFELVNLFSPVNLIKAQLRLTKRVVKKIRKKGKVFPEGQKVAANNELAALRAVMKCIYKYKLEAKIQLQHLYKWIEKLETVIREEETAAAATDPTPSPAPSSSTTAPASASKPQPQQQTGKPTPSPAPSLPTTATVSDPASASNAQPRQQPGKPTPSPAPSSPTTAPAAASKAQPQQYTGKPTPSPAPSLPTTATASDPASASNAQPQQQTGKPTPSPAPSSPTTALTSASKAQPQQQIGKPTPSSAASSLTTVRAYAPASAFQAQPQQQTGKPTPSPAPSTPTTALTSASKAQPRQQTGKPTPSPAASSLTAVLTYAPAAAPGYAPASASAPAYAPTYAPASASQAQPQQQIGKPTPSTALSSPTTALTSASKAQPQQQTGKSTYAPASAPAYAPTYAAASTSQAQPQQQTGKPTLSPAPSSLTGVPAYTPASAPAYASTPAYAPASAPAFSPQAQPQQQTGLKRSAEELEAQSNQQSGNKRCHTPLLAGATPKGPSHHLQLAGLLTGQAPPCLPAPPRYYGSPGSSPINPQMILSAGHHGSTNFNPVNQCMMPPAQQPPAQQYGSSIRPSWSTGQFSFTTTNPGVAANPSAGQFNLAGRPAGMAANTTPNWHAPHYSSNVPLGHGHRPVTYAGGYGFRPQQRPP